jgi:hypothetical protein
MLVAVGGSAPWIQQQTVGVAYEECWMADSASFKVSRFQDFKVSRFQDFKVSRFQGFKEERKCLHFDGL